MPVTPFIPLAASAIGGIFGGKAATNSAMKRSPEEERALAGANASATGLQTTGNNLVGAGLPGAQQAMGYYSTLLQGNRGAMNLATAAPRAAITDQTRGAERGLERSGLRGGIRDLASANLQRQSAGQIAGLTTGVQPMAAEGLSRLGTTLTGQGATAMSAGGNIYSRLLGEGFDNRKYARGEGEKTGSALGGLIFDVLNGTLNKKKAGGGGGLFGGGFPMSQYGGEG